MDKILYFFEKNNIKYKFYEKVEKLGLRKNNTVSSYGIILSLYSIKNKENNFTLGVKRTGRPQYILFSDNELGNILINEASQRSFIRVFKEKYLKDTIENKDQELIKDKILGNILKTLRINSGLKRSEFYERIDKSEIAGRKYEAGTLKIHHEVMFLALYMLNIKLEEYIGMFNHTDYKFKDFSINKILDNYLKNLEKIDLNDYVSADEIAEMYNLKLGTAYRFIKIANSEMQEEEAIVLKGKVYKKKFDEIYKRIREE